MSLDYLRVDYCSRTAARYAVEHWHYSGIMPTGKTVTLGAWEHDEFVGAVVYSRGASPWLGKQWDLDHVEIAELTRVAFRRHDAPISAVLSRTIRLLRDVAPGLRLLVSFADPNEGHHGGIYQASGWVYTGESNPTTEYLIGGRWRHTRGAYHRAKATNPPRRTVPGKHRYVLPLDRRMRRQVEALRSEPPRGRGLEGETAGSQPDGAGSTPADRSTT